MTRQRYETICLLQIAEEELDASLSPYLMSRQRVGQPLKNIIVEKLVVSEAYAIVVDFSQIVDVTVSVADELGPQLFRQFIDLWCDGSQQTPYLIYANLSTDLLMSIDQVFRQDNKQLVACLFAHFDQSLFYNHHFAGDGLPDAMRDVLNLIYRLGEATSTQLEEHDIVAASRKLNALTNKFPWLLKRERKMLDERAWTYVYQPIVPIRKGSK